MTLPLRLRRMLQSRLLRQSPRPGGPRCAVAGHRQSGCLCRDWVCPDQLGLLRRRSCLRFLSGQPTYGGGGNSPQSLGYAHSERRCVRRILGAPVTRRTEPVSTCPNGPVPSYKAHIPDLPVAEVAKGAVLHPAIGVAVLLPALPGEEKVE